MKWHLVHIPKNGGSSMEKVLGLPHSHEYASKTPRLRFAFVRHPLDRLVSGWEFMRARGKVRDNINERDLRQLVAEGHIVFQPQHIWLDAEMDFVGRYERLHEDWKHISDIPLPHLNRSSRNPGIGLNNFPPGTKEVAFELYRKDFELFGYSLEDTHELRRDQDRDPEQVAPRGPDGESPRVRRPRRSRVQLSHGLGL